MIAEVLFWALSACAVLGALVVLVTKDLTRLAIGLGLFLFALAGLFAWLGFGLLALAQVFLYVGGVLVLVLFAVMLIHRIEPGRPAVESRHDLLAAVASGGVFAMLVMVLRSSVADVDVVRSAPARVSEVLLGDLLPHFEVAGLLLLGALVAVVAVSRGETE